jgi:mannitol-specific phosphotransferase system IIBC component
MRSFLDTVSYIGGLIFGVSIILCIGALILIPVTRWIVIRTTAKVETKNLNEEYEEYLNEFA